MKFLGDLLSKYKNIIPTDSLKKEAVIEVIDKMFDLKLEKKGDLYIASYSVDGQKFESVGNTSIILKDIKAGILICEGVPDARMLRFMNRDGQSQQTVPQSPFEVSVDYFHIKNSGTK